VAAHGAIGRGRVEDRVANSHSNSESKGGTGKTYTLRRLARDRPRRSSLRIVAWVLVPFCALLSG